MKEFVSSVDLGDFKLAKCTTNEDIAVSVTEVEVKAPVILRVFAPDIVKTEELSETSPEVVESSRVRVSWRLTSAGNFISM